MVSRFPYLSGKDFNLTRRIPFAVLLLVPLVVIASNLLGTVAGGFEAARESGELRRHLARRRGRHPCGATMAIMTEASQQALARLRAAVAARELAYWQPSTDTELQMVHEIIDINWRIRRIR